MTKNTTEWYEQLPEPIRSQATANFNNYFTSCESLPEAIIKGFDWNDSNEGDEYWAKVHYRAKCGEFDKPKLSNEELQKSFDEAIASAKEAIEAMNELKKQIFK